MMMKMMVTMILWGFYKSKSYWVSSRKMVWPLLFRAFQNRVSWVRGETVDAGEDDNSLGFKITMIILPSLIAKKKKNTFALDHAERTCHFIKKNNVVSNKMHIAGNYKS